MELIDFKNGITSVSEEIFKAFQQNIVDEFENKNIMKIYQTSAQIANNYQQVNFQASDSIGTKLTFEDGGIKIGAGVTHIKAYGQIFFEYMPHMNYIWPQIEKNGNLIARKLHDVVTDTNYISVDVVAPLIAVQEGDVITLNFGDVNQLQPTTRQGEAETFLSVEVVREVQDDN